MKILKGLLHPNMPKKAESSEKDNAKEYSTKNQLSISKIEAIAQCYPSAYNQFVANPIINPTPFSTYCLSPGIIGEHGYLTPQALSRLSEKYIAGKIEVSILAEKKL